MNGSVTLRHAFVLLSPEAGPDPAFALRHGRPFLWWHLRELQRYGVRKFTLISPALVAPDVITSLYDSQPHEIQIATAPLTGVSVELLAPEDDRVLVVWAELLFAGNLAPFLAAARDSRFHWRMTAHDEDVRRPLILPSEHLPARLAQFATLTKSDPEAWQTYTTTGSFIDARNDTSLCPILLRPAVFLDRDGVINVDHGWVGTRDRFEWTAGVFAALRTLTDQGYHLFIVTNQSGIARDLYDEAALHELMDWVIDEIRAHGATIDDWRYCPYHPEAPLQAYRRHSNWRKPGPGMILDLIAHWKLEPDKSMLFGDQASDIEAAKAAGMTGYQVGAQSLADLISARFGNLSRDTRDESGSRGT